MADLPSPSSAERATWAFAEMLEMRDARMLALGVAVGSRSVSYNDFIKWW